MKVFVATHNAELSSAVKKSLETAGYDVSIHAIDIDKCHKAIEAFDADLLLMDAEVFHGDWDVLGTLIRLHRLPCIVMNSDMGSQNLLNAMRVGVREVIPLPLDEGILVDALSRIGAGAEQKSDSPDGRCIALMSPKGGTGTTFLACNLADALGGDFDKKVLVIDLNLQFGDAALYVSSSAPSVTLADVAKQIKRVDAAYLEAATVKVTDKFHLLAAPETPEDAVNVDAEHVKAVIDLACTLYDYVLIDMPPFLSSISVSALDKADHIYLIVQDVLPFIRDCKRLLEALTALEYGHDKIGLVVNRHQSSLDIDLVDIEKAIRLPVTHIIPNSYRLASESVNQGILVSKLSKRDPLIYAFYDFAHEIIFGKHAEKKVHHKFWPWSKS